MTSRDETPAAAAVAAATPEEIATYRAAVARLVESCRERVADWPLPDDTEPLLQWRPRL
jgi:hypothetical protein